MTISPDQLIISKSDPAGKITYCDQAFITLSGYSEDQLIGQPHNILRHPDMPAGLFYLMWQTLKEKREFNGFIKNRSKQGDSYWALINITPMFSPDGQLSGYTSASRAPNPAATTLFGIYYEQMLDSEKNHHRKDAAQQSLNQLSDMLLAMGDNYEASVFKLQFS